MSGSCRKPGPLAPFVDGCRAWLVGRGYSPWVAIRSLATLGHLGRWLERNALAVDQLTAEVVRANRYRRPVSLLVTLRHLGRWLERNALRGRSAHRRGG